MLADQKEAALTAGAAFVDGRIVPVAEATLPLMDWGFLRSSACQDTVSAWRGRLFCLDLHIARFLQSCANLRLHCPYGPDELACLLARLVRSTGLQDAYLQMIATRGVPAAGSRDPRTCKNRFFAFCLPYVNILPPGRTALSAIISDRPRIASDSVPSDIKNYHWIDFELGLIEAYDKHHDTVILSNGSGGIAEGPGFNVFRVKEGSVSTPARNVLAGITRLVAMELCKECGIDVREQDISPSDMLQADEIFCTSTAGGIFPIDKINGHNLGAAPGPVTERLTTLYWERRASGWRSTTIDLL
jgi:branched-chain amino acid aminotransferase